MDDAVLLIFVKAIHKLILNWMISRDMIVLIWGYRSTHLNRYKIFVSFTFRIRILNFLVGFYLT
jgi:hypothetical protein